MKTLIKNVQNHVVYYPTPINLSYLWSFGSLIGVFLGLQIVTGILLAMNYTPHIAYAFASVEHIMRDVPYGWLLRYMHANGASMIFIFIYAHMARGLYYQSYAHPRQEVWYSGVTLFILMAGTAFLGYVLPWGQMSYWGATVITNIITSIPLIGEPLVIWIWGGFSVNNATLNRFFSLHFVLPFVIAALAILHILLLHRVGSSNPMGVECTDVDYVPFFPYFFYKDLFAFLVAFFFFWCICIWAPNMFGHPDNYIPASPMTTPSHIVPEWYFLPFYAILKSIPSKLGGAIAMGASMALLYALPHLDQSETAGPRFKTFHHLFFTLFVLDVILLGWVGGKAPTPALVSINQVLTFGYFFHILFILPVLGLVAHRDRAQAAQ